MVPFVSALTGALLECQLRATRPRIATAMMAGTQAQFDTDIKLMIDTALARTFSTLFFGQIPTLPPQLFRSAGKIPRIPMGQRTFSIEC